MPDFSKAVGPGLVSCSGISQTVTRPSLIARIQIVHLELRPYSMAPVLALADDAVQGDDSEVAPCGLSIPGSWVLPTASGNRARQLRFRQRAMADLRETIWPRGGDYPGGPVCDLRVNRIADFHRSIEY